MVSVLKLVHSSISSAVDCLRETLGNLYVVHFSRSPIHSYNHTYIMINEYMKAKKRKSNRLPRLKCSNWKSSLFLTTWPIVCQAT